MGRSQSSIKLKALSLQHYCSQLLQPWRHTNLAYKLFLDFRSFKKIEQSLTSGSSCWKAREVASILRKKLMRCVQAFLHRYIFLGRQAYVVLEFTWRHVSHTCLRKLERCYYYINNTIYLFPHFTKKRTRTCPKVYKAFFSPNGHIFPISIVFCDVILLRTNHELAPSIQQYRLIRMI